MHESWGCEKIQFNFVPTTINYNIAERDTKISAKCQLQAHTALKLRSTGVSNVSSVHSPVQGYVT